MTADLEKTLQDLEGLDEDSQSFNSSLVQTTGRLLKKPLKDLTPGDLRLLIGQRVGLKSLLPLAIEILEHDPFIESEYYPGDLLSAILTIEPSFWRNYPRLYQEVYSLTEGFAHPLKQICEAIENLRALKREVLD